MLYSRLTFRCWLGRVISLPYLVTRAPSCFCPSSSCALGLLILRVDTAVRYVVRSSSSPILGGLVSRDRVCYTDWAGGLGRWGVLRREVCASSTLRASWFHLVTGYSPLGPREGQHWTRESKTLRALQGQPYRLTYRHAGAPRCQPGIRSRGTRQAVSEQRVRVTATRRR